ncbi:MAG: DUF4388 domain-containing protein [Nitrospirota bacterium]
MALEGTLKEFGLADIFQLIFHQRKTGTLTIKWEKKKASVLFDNGMIVSAESSERLGPDRIGEILLRAEKITKEGLREALNRQKDTGEKLGLILEEMALITRGDLQGALRLQVRETIFQLFRIKDGEYIFEQSDVEYDKDYLSQISTEFILMEGIRRIDEWPFVEKMISNFNIVFERNTDKKLDIPEQKDVKKAQPKEEDDFGVTESKGGLSQGEINIYNLIDGSRDVNAIVAISQMGDFDACKALSNLLMGGYIKRVEVTEEDLERRRPSPIIAGIKEFRSRYGGLTDILVLFSGIIILGITLLTMSFEPINSNLFNGLIYPHITKNRIERIRQAANIYRLNRRGLPGKIRELVEAGYIKDKETIDAWGEEIIIKRDSEGLIVKSKGRDRKEGTEDDLD